MNNRTRVKICGITRTEDALLCQQLGADALGFVFCRASARFIEPKLAAGIANPLAPFVTRVGLFLDATPSEVELALEAIPLLLLQFHGRETAAECERYGVPYLKAIGLADGMPSYEQLAEFEHACGFLFDSNAPGQLGGTGHAFDWNKLDAAVPKPVILAGGLGAHNVQQAITQVNPYALDVSSGVEASKGIKDHEKLHDFFSAVRVADENTHVNPQTTL